MAVLIGDADKDAVGEEHPEPPLAENTAIPMATALTLVVNVRHQQKAIRSMQPSQT